MAEVDFGRLSKLVKWPAYVMVGLGILGAQRAQVYRREWQRKFAGVAGEAMRTATGAAERASLRIGPLANGTAERAGEVAHLAVEHLPKEAHDLLSAAGDVLKDVPGEARALAREAASAGRMALSALATGIRPGPDGG
jgi:hypothetical protein